ncbi:unnamed protein product, partial [Discosporangium mesarthrocarpum]
IEETANPPASQSCHPSVPLQDAPVHCVNVQQRNALRQLQDHLGAPPGSRGVTNHGRTRAQTHAMSEAVGLVASIEVCQGPITPVVATHTTLPTCPLSALTPEPTTYRELLAHGYHEVWAEAAMAELNGLLEAGAFALAPLPPD